MEEREIPTQEQWVMDVNSQVEEHASLLARERGARQKHSIYKLPEPLSSNERRRRAYKPQVVSLGPYHHDKNDDLKAMEEHKARALRHLLVRTNRSIRDYLDALRGGGEVVQELMGAYKDLDGEWNDEDKFLRLMILDGCFLREVFREADRRTPPPQEGGYDANDPIFSYHGFLCIMPRITRDMLMIENQIPLLVLKKLLAVEQGIVGQEQEGSLDRVVNNMVLSFFGLKQQGDAELGLHVLDVVRKGMIYRISIPETVEPEDSSSDEVIWPATQLQQAGIIFENSKSESLVDVSFGIEWRKLLRKGILRLPQMLVDDSTESKLLNLMAFEQLHMGAGNEVSSYVDFMDNIIDSGEDVILLSRKNIIKNFMGTDQAVAELFNGLSHDVSIDPFTELNKVHKTVIEYCKKPQNRYCAELRLSHFKSPWSVIAVIAASFALLIAIFQFVYMFLSYYLHDS